LLAHLSPAAFFLLSVSATSVVWLSSSP
jgi:hypothetical protein